MTVPLTSSPALSASSVTQPQESIASNVALPPSLSPISGKTSPRNSVLGPIQSPKLKSGASNLPPDGFPREKESRKGEFHINFISRVIIPVLALTMLLHQLLGQEACKRRV